MPTAYTPLATQTLSSNAATVTFSSIPQTYTDLVLIMNPAASSNADNVLIQFNGDTTGNYSSTEVSGNGTVASSTRVSNASSINITNRIGTTTTLGGLAITCHFMNYANATTYKSVLIRASQAGDTYPGTSAAVGLWRSTSPITSIVVKQSGSPNFIAGSTFSLYGVASAAVVSGAKATGGDVVATDGTYWYHAFRSSGTFTPTSTLSCDVLVVAGGGAGGSSQAGAYYVGTGGGAGGVYYSSANSVSSATTVTVGAGGASKLQVYDFSGNNGSNSQFGSLTATVGGGGGIYFGATGVGKSGGSGGGGGGQNSTPTPGAGTSGQGNAGGVGLYSGGGGGGAGAVGGNSNWPTTNQNPGTGGVGTSTYSSWGLTTGTGHNVSGTVYFAGGGGGGFSDAYGTPSNYNNISSGGGGRGGSGGINSPSGQGAQSAGAGIANTGGGGGGGGSNGNTAYSGGFNSGNGGSGIIIVRYPV